MKRIKINGHVAEIVKEWSDCIWSLRFIHNGEYVGFFYANDYEFEVLK